MTLFDEKEVNELEATFITAQEVHRWIDQSGMSEQQLLVNHPKEYILARRCWSLFATLVRMGELYWEDQYKTDWQIQSYWQLRDIVKSCGGLYQMTYCIENDKVIIKKTSEV